MLVSVTHVFDVERLVVSNLRKDCYCAIPLTDRSTFGPEKHFVFQS